MKMRIERARASEGAIDWVEERAIACCKRTKRMTMAHSQLWPTIMVDERTVA